MRVFRSSLAVAATVVTLIALTSLAHAQNAAQPVGGSVSDAPVTRMEFMVVGRAPQPKPQDMPKPGSEPPGYDLTFTMTDRASQDAVTKAVKLASDLSAQWPKCRFRIASIARPSGDINTIEPSPEVIAVRVTLLGESGCLTLGK
jgi:hypothetical protein